MNDNVRNELEEVRKRLQTLPEGQDWQTLVRFLDLTDTLYGYRHLHWPEAQKCLDTVIFICNEAIDYLEAAQKANPIAGTRQVGGSYPPQS